MVDNDPALVGTVFSALKSSISENNHGISDYTHVAGSISRKTHEKLVATTAFQEVQQESQGLGRKRAVQYTVN